MAALAIALGGATAPAFGIVINIPKRSRVQATSPQLGDLAYNIQGPSTAIVSGPTLQDVTFVDMSLRADDRTLGTITMTLNPARASTGTLRSKSLPRIPGTLSSLGFPSVHTQDFYVVIEASALGPDPLVSNTPIQMQGTLPSLTPIDVRYHMISPPVKFYKRGDAGQTTVLTITDVQTDISVASAIPAASLPGMVLMVALVLGLGTAVIRRKLRSTK